VDRGPRLLGRPADGGVLLGQLPAHRLRVLLEGPAPGLLGREAPALQVPRPTVQTETCSPTFAAKSCWTASRVQRAKGRRS
jgi:hypothetical protein